MFKIVFFIIAVMSSSLMRSQVEIVVGDGTGSGTFTPVASWYNSSATESIYLGSEIGYQGEITHLAFNKASGSSTIPVEVKIYFRATSQLNLGQNDYSINSNQLNDYSLVFSGTIPNNSTTGWMEVALEHAFSFNGATSNLAVLVEGLTCIPQGRPQYRYTTTILNRMSSTYDDGSIGCDGNNPWTMQSTLKPKLERPNARFTVNGTPVVISNTENLVEQNIAVVIANGQVNISSPDSPITEFYLYDISGRQVYAVNPQTTVINVESSGFNTGVFIVKAVLGNGQKITRKLVL